MAKTARIGQGLGQLAVEEDQVPVIIKQVLVIVGLGDLELHCGIVQPELGQHIDQDGIGEGDGRSNPDNAGDVGLFAPDLAGGLFDFAKRGAEALIVAQPLIGHPKFAGRAV